MTTDAKTEAEAFAKLQEAATEGPWETLPPTPGDYDDKYSVIMARGKGEIGYCPIAEQMAQEQHKENAELLVAARNTALPRLTLKLVAECERLRELILAADRVTKERFTLDGLCDCIDNNGRPYQSDWAAKIILALQEPSR